MSGLPLPAVPPRPIPPPSDPDLEGRTPEWSDRLLPDRPLRFVADGKVGACAWATLSERAVAALTECGFDLAEARPPPYTKKDRSLLGASPGYGWIVGESDLHRGEFGFFRTQGFASFIASVQAWTDPALVKGDNDSEETPHAWIARVRAGRVRSVQVLSRYSGNVRQFRGILETEDSYTWIAPAILERLSGRPSE
jgi:hypothetical protein